MFNEHDRNYDRYKSAAVVDLALAISFTIGAALLGREFPILTKVCAASALLAVVASEVNKKKALILIRRKEDNLS